MQAPCYNCEVRTGHCHAGCPAYQDYVRRCRELHEKRARETATDGKTRGDRDMENIVKIVQPAILAEQFDAIGKDVDEKITRVQGLVVSDQNYKDAKKIRASLNREAAAYASDFREIKKQALAPWEAIEARYNSNIRDKYREADKIMKEKISTIEGGLKGQKEQEVMDYFEELPWPYMSIMIPKGR